ncbi:MAG: ABC transporter permease [Proteobacteria bacterium]|nr:ABC transporter permease [Pseudomonadota bacterium]
MTAPPAREARLAGLRRLRGLMRKEAVQIVRDPSSIIIAFVLPALLLFLFGFAVTLDARNLGVAVVVESPTEETASFTAFFQGSGYFAPRFYTERKPAEAALLRGEVQGVVVLAQAFPEALAREGGAAIQVIADGTDANTGNLFLGYVNNVWRDWLAYRALAGAGGAAEPVRAEPRIWFNPEVESHHFLVPGLLAIIMTITGALLTALLVAREYDRGTIEGLLATRARIGEILIGKLVPTFLLGMGGVAVNTAMAVWLFGVPFRGSFWVLAGASALFMAAALGMGLLISTLAKNQFVAGQVTIMVGFMPAFLLSDFVFNLAGTPGWVQAISYAIAARYFIAILKTVFLAGDVWAVILPNSLALFAMAAVLLALARALTRRRLE